MVHYCGGRSRGSQSYSYCSIEYQKLKNVQSADGQIGGSGTDLSDLRWDHRDTQVHSFFFHLLFWARERAGIIVFGGGGGDWTVAKPGGRGGDWTVAKPVENILE